LTQHFKRFTGKTPNRFASTIRIWKKSSLGTHYIEVKLGKSLKQQQN
jgi:hypothetical protein